MAVCVVIYVTMMTLYWHILTTPSVIQYLVWFIWPWNDVIVELRTGLLWIVGQSVLFCLQNYQPFLFLKFQNIHNLKKSKYLLIMWDYKKGFLEFLLRYISPKSTHKEQVCPLQLSTKLIIQSRYIAWEQMTRVLLIAC